MSGYRPCECKYTNGRPKRRYVTRKEARDAAKSLALKNGFKYRAYQCPGNTFWHVTSDGQYERRNRGK